MIEALKTFAASVFTATWKPCAYMATGFAVSHFNVLSKLYSLM
jgi:hypothetical protein